MQTAKRYLIIVGIAVAVIVVVGLVMSQSRTGVSAVASLSMLP